MVALLAAFGGASASAQSPFREEDRAGNIFARKSLGDWQATALYFSSRDYGYSSRYECVLRTEGAALSMRRLAEDRSMPMDWQFLHEERNRLQRSISVSFIELDGQRYEMGRDSWRLVEPTGDITLSFDLVQDVFRADRSDPWLPINLLTSEMLSSRRMVIGYTYEAETGRENEDGPIWETVNRRKSINMVRFRDGVSWCRDRIRQDKLDLFAKLALEDEDGNPVPLPNDSPKFLVLGFPDGARGGRGRIEGTGEPAPFDSWQFIQMIEGCGAREMLFEKGFSHNYFLFIPSSRRDRRIVECFKGATYQHFNAGIGPRVPQAFPQPDSTPFRDLESPTASAGTQED